MKKVLGFLIVALMVVSLVACEQKPTVNLGESAENGASAAPTPEESAKAAEASMAELDITEYEGTSKGHNGNVKVSVGVADGKIVSIYLVEHTETEGIYDLAVAQVVPAIIEKQSTDGIDTAAGATVSSEAIINAVKDALKDVKLG